VKEKKKEARKANKNQPKETTKDQNRKAKYTYPEGKGH